MKAVAGYDQETRSDGHHEENTGTREQRTFQNEYPSRYTRHHMPLNHTTPPDDLLCSKPGTAIRLPHVVP